MARAALGLAVLALTLLMWPAAPPDAATGAQLVAAVATSRHGAPSLLALGQQLALPAFPTVSLVAALPTALLAQIPDVSGWHTALLLGVLLHTWAALMLYDLARTEVGRGAALTATLGWAFATPALYASRSVGGPLGALALLGALRALHRLSEEDDPRAIVAGSLWLALLLLVQPSLLAAALLLAVLAAYLILDHAPQGSLSEALRAESNRPLLFLALGPVLGAAIVGVGYRWQVAGSLAWPLDNAMPLVPWPTLWLVGAGLLLLGGLLSVTPRHVWTLALLLLVGALCLVGGEAGAVASLPLGALIALPLARWGRPVQAVVLVVLVGMAALLVPAALIPQPPVSVSGMAAARLLAMRLAIGIGGAVAGLAVWARQRGAVVLAAGTMVVLVGLWLWLGDLRAFQPVAVQEVAALLPPAPPAGAELWYSDPTLAEPLLALTTPAWRLVAMPPTALSEATVAARAEGLRQRNAPLFLLLPRRSGDTGIEEALQPAFARARERGTPTYRLIELWPFAPAE